ncbi:MAG: hypothetical protein K2J83_00130 [Clostridia bacterium]|nr:hypothetical protein [Clostridia bacterium]
MRKFFTKIICFAAAVIVALGIFLISACGPNYDVKPLSPDGISDAEVISNGGFAVEKGDYIYFINGRENYTADNTFGEVVKGAVMRISKENFASRNYSAVDTVVPLIAYSGNVSAGLFIYGDYIYYTTPSTDKNSDGEIQNSHLAFRRTRLDGTGTSKNYYMQLADNTVDYRFVEVDGVVYIMYIATNENLYGTSCTNIYSYNTETDVKTMLAYNVGSYVFDSSDVENPRIFYTMTVTDFKADVSYATYYNQIYTVTADKTEPNEYDFSDVEDYDADEDPLYINCGDLVLDGVGYIEGLTDSLTQFNGTLDGESISRDKATYTYTLSSYENGYLYFTRYPSIGNNTQELYSISDKDLTSESWNSITSQEGEEYSTYITVKDAGSTKVYLYDNNGELSGALILSSTGIEKAVLVNGQIPESINNENRFYLTTDGQATLLFTAEHNGHNYIYYSLSGGNGYTVYRICYDGNYSDYNGLPTGNENSEFVSTRILDVDSLSGWYLPEMFDNQLLFIAQTENMTAYEYAMVCDLNNAEGKMMSNAEIEELNELYDGIAEDIADVDETVYENLQSALKYAFFANENEYIHELSQAYVDIKKYDYNHFWSEESLAKFEDFIAAEGDWEGYADTKKVNGKDVAANKRDYYYTVLGVMNEEDAKGYTDNLKTLYLQAYPEADPTWFESLKTGEQAGFIIGVVLGGLIIIAVAVVTPILVKRRKKKKLPQYKKGIKVDTFDDRNIDVYADEYGESSDGKKE